ncbi:hypothetical protein [Nocardia salmonicida]
MARARLDPGENRSTEVNALVKALFDLLDRAQLTNEAIRLRLSAPRTPGEPMSAQLFSMNMRERRVGPNDEIIAAIVEAAAEALDRSAASIFSTITPLVRQIPDRANFQPALELAEGGTKPTGAADEQPSIVDRATTRLFTRRSNDFKQKISWLWGLLIDGEEHRAVAELQAVFGDDKGLLVACLSDIGEADPGAVSAFLEAINESETDGGRDALFKLLEAATPWVASRIAEVPREDVPDEPEPESDVAASVDTSVLNLRPGQRLGRRLIGLVRRSDIDQARREIVDADGLLLGEDGSTGAADSVLVGMIETVDGPALASSLAEVLASDAKPGGQRALVNLVREMIRYSLDTGDRSVVADFVGALSRDPFTALVAWLAYRGQFEDDPAAAMADLSCLLAAASVEQKTRTLLEKELIEFSDLATDNLAVALTDVDALLLGMATADAAMTARFIARVVTDCDEYCNEPPEQNRAVTQTSAGLLSAFLHDRAVGLAVILDLFSNHPHPAAVLLRSVQFSRPPGYTSLLEEIVSDRRRIEALAQLLVLDDDAIRVPAYAALLDYPAVADPILRATAARHPNGIKALLHGALDLPSPALSDSIVEILNQLSPDTGWPVVTIKRREGDIVAAKALSRALSV